MEHGWVGTTFTTKGDVLVSGFRAADVGPTAKEMLARQLRKTKVASGNEGAAAENVV